MPTIQQFINNKHKYKVDTTYQRPPDVWSREDNQCLIDSIIRGEPIPLFFVNEVSDEGLYYIVDGQQRLNAIREYCENNFGLNRKYSGEENHGKRFNERDAISDEQRERFLNYKLTFHILENYNDDRIRLIFSRLQRGKPLQIGERLNAMPGSIVNRMRDISNHDFMNKSIGVHQGRYGAYPDAARILFYEKFGAKQCGSQELFTFFEKEQNLSNVDKVYTRTINTLNFLLRCFPAKPGDYKFLEKHAWVLAVYSVIRELRLIYSLNGHEDEIRRYVEGFHGKIYNEDFRTSNTDYQRFYDNIRGGWSERIIKLRRDIMIKDFLAKHEVNPLADRRQISDEDKIAAYSVSQNCQMCHTEFKDYKEPEYHHAERYADGGKSDLSNIAVLCSDCHDVIHGNSDFELPTEEEKLEEDS